jgi:transposase-like protein
VIVAAGVNSDGPREVLGMDIGPSEAETFWTAFLRKVARRGFRGVVGRRRDWSAEDKARIVAKSFEAGATVSAVARHHALSPQQLFTWRRDIRKAAEAMPAFVPAVVASESQRSFERCVTACAMTHLVHLNPR